jgi:hypothetical protein
LVPLIEKKNIQGGAGLQGKKMEISFGKSILHPNEYASGVCKRDPE